MAARGEHPSPHTHSSVPSSLTPSAPHPYNASETGATTRLPPASSLMQPHARVGWSPLSTQQIPSSPARKPLPSKQPRHLLGFCRPPYLSLFRPQLPSLAPKSHAQLCNLALSILGGTQEPKLWGLGGLWEVGFIGNSMGWSLALQGVGLDQGPCPWVRSPPHPKHPTILQLATHTHSSLLSWLWPGFPFPALSLGRPLQKEILSAKCNLIGLT